MIPVANDQAPRCEGYSRFDGSHKYFEASTVARRSAPSVKRSDCPSGSTVRSQISTVEMSNDCLPKRRRNARGAIPSE